MKKVSIIDCTLREGNQSSAVSFGIRESVHIAMMLKAVGIDMIECSHPFASDLEFQRVRALKNLDLSIPILSHARARDSDIRSVKDAGADWVGIFCGINKISRLTRLKNRSERSIIELIKSSVGLAKSLGLKVRYTVEDASRTPIDLVIAVMESAVSEGVDRICFADTLGSMKPQQVANTVNIIKSRIPGTELEIHIHDDRGFAMASSLAGIEAGADWVSTSVNGIGERCGIVDLAVLLANLDLEGYEHSFDLSIIPELSRYVGAISRSMPDDRRPIEG
jgi:2-isopropylmalate synthase